MVASSTAVTAFDGTIDVLISKTSIAPLDNVPDQSVAILLLFFKVLIRYVKYGVQLMLNPVKNEFEYLVLLSVKYVTLKIGSSFSEQSIVTISS